MCALLALFLLSGCASQPLAELELVTSVPTLVPTATPDPTPVPTPDPTPTPVPTPVPDTVITLAAVGDLMCHKYMLLDAYDKETKTYDFDSMLSDIAPYLSAADLTIGNLETPVAGEKFGYTGSAGTLNFNAPLTYLDTLKAVGFDVLTVANNHMLDKRFEGLTNTLNTLDEYGIAHAGGYRTPQERQGTTIVEVEGIRIGFVAATYGINSNHKSVPDEMEGLAWLDFDSEVMAQEIQKTKEAGADFVIACMHWGYERTTSPNGTQKKMAQALADAGADLILGHHPHVSQKVEWIESGDRKVLCFYSLSNFISNMYAPQADTGYIGYITLRQKAGQGEVTIDSASYLPAIVYKKTYQDTSEWDFRVLPMQEFIEDEAKYESLDRAMKKRIKESYEETLKIVGDAIPVTKTYPGA